MVVPRYASDTIKTAFVAWDKDGNGIISRNDLTTVLNSLGSFHTNEIDALITEVDKNGDGEIDYQEFVDWLMAPLAHTMKASGAALISAAAHCVRAETGHQDNDPATVAGALAWEFGASSKGPLKFSSAVTLDREHTLALWVRLEERPEGLEAWVPIVADALWGLIIGLAPGGGLGVKDPRNDCGCFLEELECPLDKWILLVVRGVCDTPAPGPRGRTEFLVASGMEGLRSIGSVSAVASGLVMAEFGGKIAGVAAVASVCAWARKLDDWELRELFLFDGIRFGCLTEKEAAWHRLGRRMPVPRSADEVSLLTEKLEQAAKGRAPHGVLDLNDLKITDDDLPMVLDAVAASFDNVTALQLAGNFITDDGVLEHMVPFLAGMRSTFRLDLSRNPDVRRACEAELSRTVLETMTCTVQAHSTGISHETMMVLLNETPEAAAAARDAVQDRQRTQQACQQFNQQQQELISRWSDEVDDQEEAIPITMSTDTTPFYGGPDIFPVGQKERLRELRHYLAMSSFQMYDKPNGQHYAWKCSKKPNRCGTGQLLAHFSYLAYCMDVRGAAEFGMTMRQRSGLDSGEHRRDLHSACERGDVRIEAASGRGYGANALTLKLCNTTSQQLRVYVKAGTVFEHIGWVHKQNLLVGRSVLFTLQPGETEERQIGAYCMNLSCSCAAGEKMYLTALIADGPYLASQGKVWDHFEGCFKALREANGFSDDKKKKSG